MKASELSIGNFINLQDKGIYQIDSGHDIDEIDSFDGSELEYCTGIPLTEEWLLRFGFEWKNHALRKGDFSIRQFGFGYSLFFSFEKLNKELKIKHIHQLQNLYFALTGEELELKELAK